MSSPKQNFIEELRWRNMLQDIMPETENLLNSKMVHVAIGRRIQTVGVQPDHIDRPIWVAKGQHRHRQGMRAGVEEDGVGGLRGRQVVGHGDRALSNRTSARFSG